MASRVPATNNLTRDNLRIALIEDNKDDRELLWETLLDAGFMQPLVHFDSVSAAFDYFQFLHANGSVEPHVVLLDVNMPIIDGVDALRCLNKAPAFRKTSTIVLTGADSPEIRREMAQIGIFKFLIKQHDNANVIAALDEFILLFNHEAAHAAS